MGAPRPDPRSPLPKFTPAPSLITTGSAGRPRRYAGTVKFAGSIQSSSRTPLLQVVKTSIAAIVSWLVCAVLLNQPLPIFAAIAALLVVQPSVGQSLSKGIERSVGVIVGVLLAYGIGVLFGTSSWIVLLAIVLSLLLSWAFRLAPGSANQIPISAMLVLAIGSQTPAYAFDRVLETIIGAAIALAVNASIVPPVLVVPSHVAVGRLLRQSAATLDTLSASLTTVRDAAELDALLAQARLLRGLRDTAAAAVSAGEESLSLNARRGKHRRVLERDAELLRRLTVLQTRIVGMARAVHDRYDDTLAQEPAVQEIAQEMSRAAHDLRLLGQDPQGTTTATAEIELPALTAPLSIMRPHPTHWVLIGSLLEDMRRVREEIVGSSES